MRTEHPSAAGAASIIDLHAVRAVLPVAHATLDQAEALRRLAGAVPAPAVALAIGDKIRDRATGEIGSVVSIARATAAGGLRDRVVIQFAWGRFAALACQFGEEVSAVALPCDVEAGGQA